MKKIHFEVADIIATNSTKVSAAFVNQVQEAFSMFPKSVTMRYKQNAQGQLIVSLILTHRSGMKQQIEGAADVDLISAIIPAMGRMHDDLNNYKAEEHDIETAAQGENLVMEAFKQHWEATTQRFIEKDWYDNKNRRYRCVTFTPSYNMYVKFCMEATEEVNAMILEACKPE